MQERDNQQIELQSSTKPAEHARPYEIATAADAAETAGKGTAEATADGAHAPEPVPNPKQDLTPIAS